MNTSEHDELQKKVQSALDNVIAVTKYKIRECATMLQHADIDPIQYLTIVDDNTEKNPYLRGVYQMLHDLALPPQVIMVKDISSLKDEHHPYIMCDSAFDKLVRPTIDISSYSSCAMSVNQVLSSLITTGTSVFFNGHGRSVRGAINLLLYNTDKHASIYTSTSKTLDDTKAVLCSMSSIIVNATPCNVDLSNVRMLMNSHGVDIPDYQIIIDVTGNADAYNIEGYTEAIIMKHIGKLTVLNTVLSYLQQLTFRMNKGAGVWMTN